jgi:hypothetical protein
MSHGLAGSVCKSLKQQGNSCDILQHGSRAMTSSISLKSLAIPAGFEPATHGVEIRSGSNDINSLGVPCTNGVPSGAEKPQFHAFGGALVGFAVDEQVPIGVKRHLNRRMPHEGLYLLRVIALLDPQRGAGMA